MRRGWCAVRWAGFALAITACAGPEGGGDGRGASGNGALNGAGGGGGSGAAFTTWDATRGGCLDSGTSGVNCNHYGAKEDVFLSGGPATAALADGRWTFRVLVPGNPGSIADGATGNLSDRGRSGLAGDVGAGDDVACRTFTMAGGAIDVAASTTDCSHLFGTGPDGRPAIQLFPYDDTANDDGNYILGLCPEGATNPHGCKFDAFQIAKPAPVAPLANPVFRGMKYYDANANGQLDPGEVGIAGWRIDVGGDAASTVTTGADGSFELSLAPGHATFSEEQGGGTWQQSGNLVDQTHVSSGATVSLASGAYAADAAGGAVVEGILFGNVCLGAGNAGGGGLGYWANRGNRLVTADDLAGLDALALRHKDGTDFDPASAAELSAWLLDGTAPNMAWMLSVQTAALWLSVAHGDVSGSALVYAPGSTSANAFGFLTVSALLDEAQALLVSDPLCLSGDSDRAYMEAVKNAVEGANGNQSFVQAGPESCAAPVFP